MSRALLIALILLCSTQCFAQKDSSGRTRTPEEQFEKGKRTASTGGVLLGVGAGATLASVIWLLGQDRDTDVTTAITLGALGTASMLTGIVLVSTGNTQKKKAKALLSTGSYFTPTLEKKRMPQLSIAISIGK